MPRLLTLLVACAVLLVVVSPAVAAPAAAAADEEDFYAVLGLKEQGEDATEREIKTSWRKLSKKHHPDVSGESERETYQRIQRAYEVLGDRRKRKVYDILGMEGVRDYEMPHQQQQQQQHPFMHLFGGGGGDGGQASGRGQDMDLVLQVSLEDVYNGGAHSIALHKTKICRACRGSGAKSAAHLVRCPHCKGAGRTMQRVQIAPGFVQQMEQQCSRCGGSGKHVSAKCSQCKGNKVTNGEAHISVDVEVGIPDGHILVYDLEANQEPGKVPGDVKVTIVTAPHERFQRRGDDLYTTVRLTLREALLGFEKTIPHLDAHTVELSEDDVIAHATVRKILGEGMPKHHVPSERGDLYVTYELDLPTVVTGEQREVFNKVLP